MKAARRRADNTTMGKPRKVLFEAVNDMGQQKRIGKIKCSLIHSITWQFGSDDSTILLPSDSLSIRNNEGSVDLVSVGEDGVRGSIVYDEPFPFSDFYVNFKCEPNQFIPGGLKRVYGFFTVTNL